MYHGANHDNVVVMKVSRLDLWRERIYRIVVSFFAGMSRCSLPRFFEP